MIDFEKYAPYPWNKFRFKNRDGQIREGYFNQNFGCYRYSDLTAMWQQSIFSCDEILEWEYLDKTLMDDLYFYDNKWWREYKAEKRREEADRILAKIKTNPLQNLIIKLKHELKHLYR